MPTGGRNVDQVPIFPNGKVLVAATGVSMPTDIATAWSASFYDCGYITEDGVTWTPNVETGEVRAWQSRNPLKRFVTSRAEEFSFSVMQWTRTNWQLAMGGGTWATASSIHTFTPPDEDDLDHRAFGIEAIYGSYTYRLTIPKAMVTNLSEINFRADQNTPIPLTVAVERTDGVQPWSFFTNDPAFQSGS